jgi:mRNA interferase HigB
VDWPDLWTATELWISEIERAEWKSTSDIKGKHASASITTADQIVFNIKGNSYRLVVSVDFRKSIVYVKWIGTHADYDKTDVRTVNHGK